ncbi:Uncharacterised protein [Vibrio cholerae]|uniref:Uncharacterized protein n=1 Tax=Vibrio cholerae TaxID=666 RepID=A0A655QSS8_VIBCL|nr:Uncharacterised protein [Vibrio cholerae]CSA76293.1 Uncharacterised protein [Vibrio cholerae]CSB63503.1 Uncharacterised protein [Vibrio cholerae]CSC29235.1 Uncharacterised protein [Vibrio cholerae]CSD29024.1 Uncharacterised protein [Vibrio cholerae]
MVFDNAVVYHRNVTRNMGVSIDLRRLTMRCPTGMRDTCTARDLRRFNRIRQLLYFTQTA